jgi:hypothetical protein
LEESRGRERETDKWRRQVKVNGEIGEREAGKKEEEKFSSSFAFCPFPFALIVR